MQTTNINAGKRFAAADWADQQKRIFLIGAGGIGSWTALNLTRIGHSIFILDGDSVDETNVEGGQMFRRKDVGRNKASAIAEICREFGAVSTIDVIDEDYTEDWDGEDVMICAVDNMAARKLAFEKWLQHVEWQIEDTGSAAHCIFMDGRLLLENMEIFTIRGNDEKAMEEYRKHLFDDGDIPDLECTGKQTTFSAMIIAGLITSTFCNWVTNEKLGMVMREVPFWQRFFLPTFNYRATEAVAIEEPILL